MSKEVKETVPPKQVTKYLKHTESGEIFPWSAFIAINPHLIPTNEEPAWAAKKDEPVSAPAPAEPVKKGPFGRPIKAEVNTEE